MADFMGSKGLIPEAKQPLALIAGHAAGNCAPLPLTLSFGGVGISDDSDDEPRKQNEVGGDEEGDDASFHSQIIRIII